MADTFSWGVPNSQVIRSGQQVRDDYNSWLDGWNKSLAAINNSPAPLTREQNAYNTAYNHDFSDFFSQQSAYNPVWSTQAQQDWYRGQYANDTMATQLAGGFTDADKAFIGSNPDLASIAGYDPDQVARQNAAAVAALYKQKEEKDAEFNTFLDGEKRQNAAYQGLLGGGFQGGFTNEDYTNPFAGTTGQDGATTFGSLAANAGASLGQSTPNGIAAAGQPTGFGTMQGMGATPKQLNAGWGGPFDQWRW